MSKEMTVDELIHKLKQVKDKRQVVGACLYGAEISETWIVDVVSEVPDENDDPGTIGVCWLKIPENSTVHVDP